MVFQLENDITPSYVYMEKLFIWLPKIQFNDDKFNVKSLSEAYHLSLVQPILNVAAEYVSIVFTVAVDNDNCQSVNHPCFPHPFIAISGRQKGFLRLILDRTTTR